MGVLVSRFSSCHHQLAQREGWWEGGGGGSVYATETSPNASLHNTCVASSNKDINHQVCHMQGARTWCMSAALT